MIDKVKLEREYRKYTTDHMKKAIGDANDLVYGEITTKPSDVAVAVIAAAMFERRTDPYHFWEQRNSVRILEEKTRKETDHDA